MKPASKRRDRQPPRPRPVTASYLRNAAMHYLSGRSASVAMLRQTLERRAKRRLIVKSLEPETKSLIAKSIDELVGLGLVDDRKFAANRAATLTRKGLARRRITEGLRIKGISNELAADAIDPDLSELDQARRFVERKRLGPYRRGEPSPQSHQKDLRALARAGFSLAIAKSALGS